MLAEAGRCIPRLGRRPRKFYAGLLCRRLLNPRGRAASDTRVRLSDLDVFVELSPSKGQGTPGWRCGAEASESIEPTSRRRSIDSLQVVSGVERRFRRGRVSIYRLSRGDRRRVSEPAGLPAASRLAGAPTGSQPEMRRLARFWPHAARVGRSFRVFCAWFAMKCKHPVSDRWQNAWTCGTSTGGVVGRCARTSGRELAAYLSRKGAPPHA
jgi:hypothetical protein